MAAGASNGWYFYQMVAVEKALCGYCITGALANMGIAALSLPEGLVALEIYLAEK